MSKKYSSRATKIVLASLLATSATVPALVSAEVGGTVTRTGEAVTTSEAADTINFTITDDKNMLSRYIKGPGTLVEIKGQKYISLTIDEATLAMITEFTVDGKSVITDTPVGKKVAIPVNENLDAVQGNIKLYVAAIGRDVAADFTLTPVKSGTEQPTQPTTPAKPEAAPAPLKYVAYNEVPDGEYKVSFDAYSAKTGEGNYTSITRHLEDEAILVVKEGKYFLQIQATEASNSMIAEYYVKSEGEFVKLEALTGSTEQYPHAVQIPLKSLNEITDAKLLVVAKDEEGKVIHQMPYEFGIAIDKGQALPQIMPTYVYKDGETSLSTMHDKYLTASSNVELNKDGKYEVDLTFPEGQHIVGFEFDGKTVANPVNTNDEKGNIVSVYTVTVDDISKIYTATVDLHVKSVIAGKPFEYKSVYDVQVQFGGKQNPFNDVVNSYAYSNIINLYNKGIFLKDKSFNPTNELPRAHFALMMARAFELEVPETTVFTDIASRSEEERNAVKALNNYGIINGATATTFNPEGKIKRYEAALMINRMLEKQGIKAEEGLTSNFTDLASMTSDAKEAIAHLASLSIVNGKGNNKFDPSGQLTRQEMAIILDKTLKLIEKQ